MSPTNTRSVRYSSRRRCRFERNRSSCSGMSPQSSPSSSSRSSSSTASTAPSTARDSRDHRALAGTLADRGGLRPSSSTSSKSVSSSQYCSSTWSGSTRPRTVDRVTSPVRGMIFFFFAMVAPPRGFDSLCTSTCNVRPGREEGTFSANFFPRAQAASSSSSGPQNSHAQAKGSSGSQPYTVSRVSKTNSTTSSLWSLFLMSRSMW